MMEELQQQHHNKVREIANRKPQEREHAQLKQQREGVQQQLPRKDEELEENEQQIKELERRLKQLELQQQNWEVERKLRENLEVTSEELRRQIQECDEKIADLQQQTQQRKERIETLETHQPVLKLPNYSLLKRKDFVWYSEPLYVAGYKYCIAVHPKGYSGGRDTHVGVWACILKGEFDTIVKWPAKCKITLKLLNHRDQNHITVTQEIDLYRVNPDPKNPRNEISLLRPAFSQKFVAHDEIAQYLKDDCLMFRIVEAKLI